MCSSSEAPSPMMCTPKSAFVDGSKMSFKRPVVSPRIWPRAISRKKAIPTSYGTPSSVSRSSVFPIKEISGMVYPIGIIRAVGIRRHAEGSGGGDASLFHRNRAEAGEADDVSHGIHMGLFGLVIFID